MASPDYQRNPTHSERHSTMIVYADTVLAVNLVMNSIILGLTAVVTGSPIHLWRILGAALGGAACVLFSAHPALAALQYLPAKLILSALIVIGAFRYGTLRLFLLRIAGFYLISFLMGGAVLGWISLEGSLPARRSGDNLTIGYDSLLAGALMAAALAAILMRLLRRRALQPGLCRTLRIAYGGRAVSLTALLDTGNSLRSLWGRPVIPTAADSLLPLFSDETAKYLTGRHPDLWLHDLDQCGDSLWLRRVEALPLRTVTGAGLILAFRPDSITVTDGKGTIRHVSAVIALSGASFAADGSYQALLHPDLLPVAATQREENQCA